MKLTSKVRIATGIVLVAVGFGVGFTDFLRIGFPSLQAIVTAWALIIAGLIVLLFRRSEAPIATGIALVVVAPTLWLLVILTPIKTAFFLFFPFLVAGAVALYGVYILLIGLAERRRQDEG